MRKIPIARLIFVELLSVAIAAAGGYLLRPKFPPPAQPTHVTMIGVNGQPAAIVIADDHGEQLAIDAAECHADKSCLGIVRKLAEAGKIDERNITYSPLKDNNYRDTL